MIKQQDIQRLDNLLMSFDDYAKLASEYNIPDIFTHNGGKTLQILVRLGIKGLTGITGNDAIDEEFVEYEIKTLDRESRRLRTVNKQCLFSIAYTLTEELLDRYKKAIWIFGVFEKHNLKEIYKIHPKFLENRYFDHWSDNLHLKGVKISLDFIQDNGQLMYKIS